MKLKFIILVGMLSISSIGFAMSSETIKMPDAQTLQARLHKYGFQYLVEKTDIVKQLADQEKVPIGVAVTIELYFADYAEDLKKNTPGAALKIMMCTLEMNKPRLFEALLEDEQEALDELKILGLYKPIE